MLVVSISYSQDTIQTSKEDSLIKIINIRVANLESYSKYRFKLS